MSIVSTRRTCTLALTVALIAGARAASASTITLGTRITLSPTTFALPVEIADAVDVTSWDFSLTYDPTDVQVNLACDSFAGDPYCSLLTGPVTEGDFFASGAPFNLLVPGFVALDPGTLAQTGLLFGVHGEYGGFPPLPSGSGTLAFIEFTVLGTGTGGIDVDGSPPSSVPEPGTLVLFTTGLGLAKAWRARRRRHFVIITALALWSSTATAQTTAPGPYYATPSWDQNLPCDTPANCSRFVVLSNWNHMLGDFIFPGAAVLDRETGLVWERYPNPSPQNWVAARDTCRNNIAGNRKGWRLPTKEELASLVDPSRKNPALPASHPFFNVQSSRYWAIPDSPDGALAVDLGGERVPTTGRFSRYEHFFVWCVRGGQGVSTQ